MNKKIKFAKPIITLNISEQERKMIEALKAKIK